MKKIILIMPFIIMACGPSAKELKAEAGRKEADSLMKALEISKVNYEMKQIQIQAETDSLLFQAKMKALQNK